MAKSSISESIRVDQGEIAKVVLMPGDPLRAKYVAENFLEDTVCFNTVRNMLGYTGTYKGKQISVMGHGMGVPSLGIYATELFNQFGVDAIIRIGSTGALAEDVHVRDLVIAMTASTDSNYGSNYGLWGYFAPCANYDMLADAVDAAKEIGATYHVGAVYTADHFYNADPDFNKKAADLNHLCVEMETAGLYWTATACHKKALSILTVSDHVMTGESLPAEDREKSFSEMMEVALETAWKCIE